MPLTVIVVIKSDVGREIAGEKAHYHNVNSAVEKP